MTAKKILFLDQFAAMGGGQTVLSSVIEVYLQESWQVTVMAPAGGEFQKHLSEKFGAKLKFVPLEVPLLSIGKKSFRDVIRLLIPLLQLWSKRKLMQEADLVYVNGSRLLPLAGLLSLVVKSRFVYHIHLDHSQGQKRILAFISRLKRSRAILVNSHFVLSRLTGFPGLRQLKLRLLRCSLDRPMSALEFKDRVSAPQLSPAVLVLGRLSADKGQAVVTEAAQELPGFDFHLVGGTDFQDPSFETKLRASAPPNVKFAGKTANVPATVESLNPAFSVVPSQWEEPFGLVGIESMAMSLVTLTSGRGGLKEISDETGALTFTDAADLKLKLQGLVQDRNALLILAQTQHKRTQERFAWRIFEKELVRLTGTFMDGGKI